jgi:multiple sugar transport system permease protein
MAVASHRRGEARRSGTFTLFGRRVSVGAVLKYTLILVAAAFILFPLYWVAVTSIKPASDYATRPPVWFPADPTAAHWRVLGGLRGWEGFKNSIIVAAVTTVASVGIGAIGAYSIARFRTGGKHLPFWILSQRMMPPVAAVIPIFLLYQKVDLLDTYFGLILLYTVFALPFSVWMMFTYFRQIPPDIEESALVDGCSRFQALWKVAIPLSAPGLVSAAVFSFIFAWTDFLFALILTSTKTVTLPVVVSGFVGVQASLLGELGALAVLSMIPAFTLGLIVQRHLVRGLTFGAVRG